MWFSFRSLYNRCCSYESNVSQGMHAWPRWQDVESEPCTSLLLCRVVNYTQKTTVGSKRQSITRLPYGATFGIYCLNHCFPINLPTFLCNIFYVKNMPFVKYQLLQLTKQSILDYLTNVYPYFREKIQCNINRCELFFWSSTDFPDW